MNDRSGVPADGSMVWISFSVEDTGIGMSDEVQRKIFQVFTQADSSMSRKFGGSGLGLAICKQLAELMNGTIGVKSQPNQGSTFWCDIPFRLTSPALSKKNIPLPMEGKEVWVMCPLQSSAWVITQLLQEMGARVVRVDNIQYAQTLIEHSHAAGLDLHGLIVDGHLEEERIGQWLETIRCSSFFRNVKIWSLKPFWLHKDDEGKIFPLDGMITLPIHREQFYLCLLGETGHRSQQGVIHVSENHATEKSKIDFGFLEPLHTRENVGPFVLVVEDNPVNQAVASGMLRMLGCHLTIVETGTQAVNVIKERDVDCIMMDLELPEMDGLTTTRVIRDLENAGRVVHMNTSWRRRHAAASSPVNHVPIVGMTAHVLPEHAQQCLRSGMDECLSKPVHLHDFRRVLQRWVGFLPGNPVSPSFRKEGHSALLGIHQACIKDSGGNPGKTSTKSQIGLEEYDVSIALKGMDGDEALLHSLFQIFIDTIPGVIQGMLKSIQIKDRQDFQRQAHQLKGALSAVHARHDAKLVERLENMASVAPFFQLETEAAALEDIMQKLVNMFQDLLSVRGDKGGNSSQKISCHEPGVYEEKIPVKSRK
jgi:CheY-like chemotaxis protein/HPt (histidine-containing phosphotransfer) domain-containing protein